MSLGFLIPPESRLDGLGQVKVRLSKVMSMWVILYAIICEIYIVCETAFYFHPPEERKGRGGGQEEGSFKAAIYQYQ